ncbi:phage tail family protein [Acaricomes phytoseiuli]|uniref:phage tail family protein n=1 Tax=Acaricomes phytoseiuli TaxID=291968 RepID=UPI002222F2F4|nr:phage tail family protein [Acaricomes phytoseiuli]MCW1250706.1 phage tail family protein [Acaricomes phytoseiuli]
MWQIAPGVKPFLSQTTPFFPVILSSSTIGGEFFLPVEGDQPTWPVYTITGPGGDPIIERVDTGQKIAFSGQIATGKAVTFDTSQGTVTSPGVPAEDLWPRVGPESDFFSIGPGPVRLRVRFTSASEMSSLTVSYIPQYLTGY